MQLISELWVSRNQEDWDAALKSYWENPSVKRNLEIEAYMDKLNPEAIKRLNRQEWYTFLNKYFRWKFTDPRFIQTRLNNLDTNSLETLFSIKEKLFAFDPRDVQKGLEITTSKKGIKGLGPAGASGLLAVLFPKGWEFHHEISNEKSPQTISRSAHPFSGIANPRIVRGLLNRQAGRGETHLGTPRRLHRRRSAPRRAAGKFHPAAPRQN